MAVRGFCVVGPIWSARSPTFSQSGLRAGLLHLADGSRIRLPWWAADGVRGGERGGFGGKQEMNV